MLMVAINEGEWHHGNKENHRARMEAKECDN